MTGGIQLPAIKQLIAHIVHFSRSQLHRILHFAAFIEVGPDGFRERHLQRPFQQRQPGVAGGSIVDIVDTGLRAGEEQRQQVGCDVQSCTAVGQVDQPFLLVGITDQKGLEGAVVAPLPNRFPCACQLIAYPQAPLQGIAAFLQLTVGLRGEHLGPGRFFQPLTV